MLAAASLRLYALNMKPMHHDEGVNGFFLTNLMRQGVYHYDPSNYHGPTLYFITLPLAFVADKLHILDSWVLRLVTVAFGVGTVWLVLALRRYVGAVGGARGAALVAVSPACVFYSRYFIHEIPLRLLHARHRRRRAPLPRDGRGHRPPTGSASAAMMFATKETAFISVGTLGLAWLTAWTWER
jgi:predicted membrane-bound mannosyltransferase